VILVDLHFLAWCIGTFNISTRSQYHTYRDMQQCSVEPKLNNSGATKNAQRADGLEAVTFHATSAPRLECYGYFRAQGKLSPEVTTCLRFECFGSVLSFPSWRIWRLTKINDVRAVIRANLKILSPNFGWRLKKPEK